MKHFTKAIVEKWNRQGNLMCKGRPPYPFPGKSPTRIYLHGPDFEYLGKPSSALYHRWIKVLKSVQDGRNEYFCAEFDRGGLIYVYEWEFFNGGKNRTNKDLLDFYHHGIYIDTAFAWMIHKYTVTPKHQYSLVGW